MSAWVTSADERSVTATFSARFLDLDRSREGVRRYLEDLGGIWLREPSGRIARHGDPQGPRRGHLDYFLLSPYLITAQYLTDPNPYASAQGPNPFPGEMEVRAAATVAGCRSLEGMLSFEEFLGRGALQLCDGRSGADETGYRLPDTR